MSSVELSTIGIRSGPRPACFHRNWTAVLAVVFVSAHASVAVGKVGEPNVFLLDGAHLKAARELLATGDQDLQPAHVALRRDADRALDDGPFSVVNKEVTPPSGDQHDYMSLAPYWWP